MSQTLIHPPQSNSGHSKKLECTCNLQPQVLPQLSLHFSFVETFRNQG
jgi:hypothetical protein